MEHGCSHSGLSGDPFPSPRIHQKSLFWATHGQCGFLSLAPRESGVGHPRRRLGQRPALTFAAAPPRSPAAGKSFTLGGEQRTGWLSRGPFEAKRPALASAVCSRRAARPAFWGLELRRAWAGPGGPGSRGEVNAGRACRDVERRSGLGQWVSAGPAGPEARRPLLLSLVPGVRASLAAPPPLLRPLLSSPRAEPPSQPGASHGERRRKRRGERGRAREGREERRGTIRSGPRAPAP